jgi:isopentenyl diphosphate isomerase/L-lactate dehydrogenase-like FMN-dependent dehydrogenase
MGTPQNTVASIAERGMAALDLALYEHVALGAGTNSTIAQNRAGWDAYKFIPSILRGHGRGRTNTTLLGHELALPVIVAPMGPVRAMWEGGTVAVAEATERAGTLGTIALTASPALEDARRAGSGPLWFQIYWWSERDWITRLLRRAEQSGYEGIVLTIDTPAYGHREHDQRRGYIQYERFGTPNIDHDPPDPVGREEFRARVSWHDAAWLVENTTLPVILKGVMNGADAAKAVDIGMSAVWVSNHGGRMLDHAISTARALTDVAASVDVPIIADSGIGSAADVVKALSLGATATAIGRLAGWGLAAGGADSLVEMLELLQWDIADVLTLLGVASVVDLDPTVVVKE